jgi:hypothetical protein
MRIKRVGKREAACHGVVKDEAGEAKIGDRDSGFGMCSEGALLGLLPLFDRYFEAGDGVP